MKTKPVSIIMIIVGIIIISYTGYLELRSEKTSIDKNLIIENSQTDQWSTYIGLVILIGGFIILMRTLRKPNIKSNV